MLGLDHTILAQDKYWDQGQSWEPVRPSGWVEKPIVFISNGDDDHYWMGLENWVEVQIMISKLKAAALEAFGPEGNPNV